jgi:hypothetical protein
MQRERMAVFGATLPLAVAWAKAGNPPDPALQSVAVKGWFGAPAVTEPRRRRSYDPQRMARAGFNVKLGC